MRNVKDKSLAVYAVTDRNWLGEDTLLHQVELAIEGGATFIQLREKNLDEQHFLKEAVDIQELCKKHHIPFVVNDNVAIALQMNADGVHVGQSDMEAGKVREKLGADKILGVSAETVEQAILAEKNGADYLGVGAVFPTGSKTDAADVSLDTLREICKSVSIPVVAIGGISQQNVCELKGTGIVGIAVISAIFGQSDIKDATEKLSQSVQELLQGAVKK
ncbi:thiamine phosphate synthase [Streptococcus iniae]|nr:thiamine phosphate synthase [Streptococcus iniae]